MKTKKLGIFDPYLDTVGGGERYCLTLAEALLKKDWQVDVFWPDKEIETKLRQKLALDLNRVNIVPFSPYGINLLKRRQIERNYDFLFYISDGSLPFMFGKQNILHFQVPFKNVLKRTFLNTLKLKKIKSVVCNSIFTKKIIDACLGISSVVVYPPVDVQPLRSLEKENVILYVGRFSQLLQGKRQDVLIEVFRNLVDRGLKDWKLILAGGSEVGGRQFVEKLEKMSRGYPIEIVENPPFDRLAELYGKAKIFWSASGFAVDEKKEPEKVEHFGMSTVEAMAAGCVPIVLGKGGQPEIVKEGKNGLYWQEKDELADKTLSLITNEKITQELAKKAILRSKEFAKEKFYEKIYCLVGENS